MQASRSANDLRRRVYEVLERGSPGDRASLLVDRLIIALIAVNLVAVALESVPSLAARYGVAFAAIEYASLVIFTVEYALRIWVAVEHAPYRRGSGLASRLRYIVSGYGIVDLISVLPFWFGFLLPSDLRVVLVLRMIRFFKIARYSTAMRSLLDVLYGATLMAAAVMHLVEGHVQPDKFGTIPDAMWWAIVTLGTIGYGDVVPVTIAGKLVAGVTIVFGLVMIALPVGIIATAFNEQIHRREFVVTWSMVAKVPLFSGLNAAEIADVMRLLRAQQVEAGTIIVRRGEPGHSMYFIAAGEVEIDLPGEQVRLGVGHFFGEVAVLQRARRSATVTAVTRTSLLVLDARDLRALMDRDPRIAERVQQMARRRIKHELVTPKGDIVTEEIEDERPAPTDQQD
jgi:voltage-gated potassium channel